MIIVCNQTYQRHPLYSKTFSALPLFFRYLCCGNMAYLLKSRVIQSLTRPTSIIRFSCWEQNTFFMLVYFSKVTYYLEKLFCWLKRTESQEIQPYWRTIKCQNTVDVIFSIKNTGNLMNLPKYNYFLSIWRTSLRMEWAITCISHFLRSLCWKWRVTLKSI